MHYNLMKQIGDVRATKIDQATGAVGAKSERVWSAAEKLNTLVKEQDKDGNYIGWKKRKIYTTLDGLFPSSQNEPTIELNERALRTQGEAYAPSGSVIDNISDQAALGGYSWDGSGTPPESKLLSYLKGDISNEGAGFPRRDSLLGEVHSGIVTYKNLVYVQTGEGMLHAFDINTGEEKWAYMPKLYLRSLPMVERLPYGLPPEGTLKKLYPDDDLAPLNVGKIALVRVGKELVLMGATGGLIRDQATQSARMPIFYALTIEDASGAVTDIPKARWANLGPCNYSINTTIPNCGQAPIVENWKIGYLSDGADQAVGFMPSGIAHNGLVRDAQYDGKVGDVYFQPQQSSAHVLNVFSADTGRFTLIYSKREYSGLNGQQSADDPALMALFDKFTKTTFTDVDFSLDSKPLVTYPNEKAIKDIYVGDGMGYIWRLDVQGKTFQDLFVSPTYQKASTVAGRNNTYYDSVVNFVPSYIGEQPIYRIKVASQNLERGGVAGATKGQMILFGTSGSQDIRVAKQPFVNKGVNIIAGYFDAPNLPVAGSGDLVPQLRKLVVVK